MNPFKYGKIVKGEYFYDRVDELSRVKSTLAGGNDLVLYAPRRYGKSSLVQKTLNELEKEGFITVYLDFMSIFSKEIVNKYDLGANSTTQKAIYTFIDEGIIEQFDNKFEFSDPIYKMFLLRYM